MSKLKKWIITLAVLLLAGIATFVTWLNVKGAPAVDPGQYARDRQALDPGTEFAPLQGGTRPVAGMNLAAKNDVLELYIHPETTEIAVVDLRGGHVWYSNPEARDSDPIASAYIKEVLSSQFSITFRDERGLLSTFINYSDSISRGQFTMENIENGVRVNYTLGDMSVGIEALPKLISKARMEEKFLSKLDEQTGRFFSTKYFPSKTNPDVLERIDAAASRPLTLKRMMDIMAQVGYTEEDLAYDNAENGIETMATEDRPQFTVPLEYRLDGDSLYVTVPVSQIVEKEGYKVRTINLLEYFGAAGTDEEGYMVVPDGPGGLIYLNNGKINTEVYSQRIYGIDQNDNAFRRAQVAQSVRMPVFGMKAGDHAWFAEVTEGDTIANINADISGRNNSFNNLYASFMIRGEDTLDIYKGTQWEEVQLLTDDHITHDVTVRYSFLSGKEASYSGMAKLYRERLEASGVLKPLSEERDLPFYVSMLGAIDKRKTFLGVPYKGMVSMTTFKDAAALADRLHGDGIGNIRMLYLGWFDKGLNHDIPTDLDLEGAVGSLKDMKALDAKLAGMGGKLYPDVAFQHVFDDTYDFSPASDAARFVTREVAERTPYNRALNGMDYDLGSYYLLSPAKLPHFVDKFIKAYKKIGIDAVSLRDLGDLLHSDFRTKRIVFRENAKNIVREQLAKIRDAYPNVLVSGGNAYAWSVSDQFVNVPIATSKFNIVDAEIPFMQMVLHGYADYAGSPINLSDEQDVTAHLLKLAELGAAPHFLWSKESSSNLKFTRYDHLFSTEYAIWYDQAVDMYDRLNEVFGRLRQAKMEEHVLHGPGVAEIRYDNGTTVYVNYTDNPVTVNGVTIEAKNFTTGGENK